MSDIVVIVYPGSEAGRVTLTRVTLSESNSRLNLAGALTATTLVASASNFTVVSDSFLATDIRFSTQSKLELSAKNAGSIDQLSVIESGMPTSGGGGGGPRGVDFRVRGCKGCRGCKGSGCRGIRTDIYSFKLLGLLLIISLQQMFMQRVRPIEVGCFCDPFNSYKAVLSRAKLRAPSPAWWLKIPLSQRFFRVLQLPQQL
jgi:hypothetical protein